MQLFLLLTVGFALVNSQCDQSSSTPSNAVSSPTCKLDVTIDPEGVSPWLSPHYGILSSIKEMDGADSRCATFFCLSNGKYLVITTLSKTDGSFLITKNIREDVVGSPGTYTVTIYQSGNNGSSSCIYNSYTLSGLNETCAGTYVLQRCISGDCPGQYNSSVQAFYSALRPQPSSCRSSISTLLQKQGLESLVLYDLPNKCPLCVTKYNNMTAINADCIDKAQRLEIVESDLSSCYC